jgi:hypothetical protein
MDTRLVIAADGREVPLSSVVKIGERYYHKHSNRKVKLENPQYYVIMISINGVDKPRRLAPANSNFDWDYGKEEYVQITDEHVFGVVNESGQKGHFIPTKETVTVNVLERYNDPPQEMLLMKPFQKGIMRSVIDGKLYIVPADKKMERGLFYPLNPREAVSAELHKRLSPKNIHKNGGYSSFNVSSYGQQGNDGFLVATTASKEYWKNNAPESALDKYEKLLLFKSCGAEFEAASGYIREQDCLNLGLVPVKDGSITGTSFEYITTILQEKKLSKLLKITGLLNNVLTVNESCSLHFHIGGIDNSPKNTVSLFMLFYQLNKEFFDILAPYKKDMTYFASKKPIKDHCKDLPSLRLFDRCPIKAASKTQIDNFVTEAFADILKFLNENHVPEKGRDGQYKHCKEGRNKWEWNTRYYAVNFLPFLFENKKTLEFRSHTPTTNSEKTINWLFIINAVLKYALENADSVICRKEKVNLTDCVEFSYLEDAPELCEYLKAYILKRKKDHEDKYLSGDIYGDEFDKDNGYSFAHKNKKLIYG